MRSLDDAVSIENPYQCELELLLTVFLLPVTEVVGGDRVIKQFLWVPDSKSLLQL